MKSANLILALWLGASAWALTTPKPQATPPVAAAPGQADAKPSAKSPAQSARRKQGPRRTATHSVRTAGAASGKPVIRSKRDPFVSPVVERVRESATCTGSGRQCLLVGEITLRGVVRSPSGFIAVVVNGDHTYFLRENDPLADGAVERINNNAIILRERSTDALGRPLTREVTRKLGASAD
jgi:hypothetical protein